MVSQGVGLVCLKCVYAPQSRGVPGSPQSYGNAIFPEGKWSGRLDSNQRPLGPEPSALPS